MLVNQSIPNFFQGISQQPAVLRQPTQAESQENAYSSIVEGLKKRPPTTHVAKLGSLASIPDAYVHTINRDTSERYSVVITNGDLYVYDMAGNAQTVSFPDGKGYLSATTPRSSFACVTVADYTFVVNKTKVVALTSAAAGWSTNTVYFHVTNAIQNITYTATVDGVSANYASGTATDSASVASSIATALGTALGAGYTVTSPIKNIIKVVKGSGSISSASSQDGWGNNALKTIFQQVQRFSDLPQRFETGYPIKIVGDSSGAFTAYYVEWKESGNTGVWKECVCPGLQNGFDATTMPFKLVRTGVGTFSFSKVTWSSRAAGDTSSAPQPSFVGRTINEVFYYRNRLGFLSDENVILSVVSDFYNFWRGTITTVLDTDPIDVSVATNKVALLRYAVPFTSELMLFSDQTQFKLSSGTNSAAALTSKSVTISPTTQYEISADCRPIGMGQDVYFATKKGSYTAVREYYVQPMTYTNTAADITAHVPTYIPSGVFKMAAGLTDDTFFMLSTSARNKVWTYKFYWGDNDQKLQSSWSVWSLDSSDVILNCEVLDTKLYLVIQRSDGVYLEYIDIQPQLIDSGMGILVNLDRKVTLTGSYNSGTDTTTWTLPYTDAANTFSVVLGSSWGVQKGTILTTSRPTGNTVTSSGNYSSYPVYVGKNYTMTYRLSNIFFRDQNKAAITQNNLKLKYIDLVYANSGYFKVKVIAPYRDVSTFTFTGNTLGSTSVLGNINLASGVYRVPLMNDSDGLFIEIVNDSFLPSFLQSAEWNAMMNFNFRRT